MSLGTGIQIPNNFDLNAPLPIDARFIAADITARNAIPTIPRYDGLLVYVVADKKMYQLQGGVTNADWAEAGGGSAPTAVYKDEVYTDANGVKVAWALTAVPTDFLQVLVIVGGVPQDPGVGAYTLATAAGVTTLTLSEAPIAGDNVRIKYGVVSASVADGSITLAKLSNTINVVYSPTISAFQQVGIGVSTIATAPSITTKGRTVKISLIPDGLSAANVNIVNTGSVSIGYFAIRRNGGLIWQGQIGSQAVGISGIGVTMPPTHIEFEDEGLAAGSYVYTLEGEVVNANTTLRVNNCKLKVKEQ